MSGIVFGSDMDREKKEPTSMKRDREQGIDVIEHVQNSMTDIFNNEAFRNIASGWHVRKSMILSSIR